MSKTKLSSTPNTPNVEKYLNEQTPIPAWWTHNVIEKFRRGEAHGFILHFNVKDYIVSPYRLVDFIDRALSARPIIVHYNLAAGITFAKPEMRDAFDKFVGADAQNSDPTSTALANLGIGKPSSSQSQDEKPPLPKQPAAALPMLETFLKNAVKEQGGNGELIGQGVVIIEHAETICPNADIAMMSPDDRKALVTLQRLTNPEIAKTGNFIFLVAENVLGLHENLRRPSAAYEQVEIPIPNYAERMAYIARYLSAQSLALEAGLTPESFASETAMLNYIQIEDVCLRGKANENQITREMIRNRKRDIIAAEFGEVVEVMDTDFTFADIGGLEKIKAFFRKSVIAPIHNGNLTRVPMGVLLTGPAGTGKSIMALAVAHESGVNCIALNPAKLFGQFVGNTERNLDRALRAIVAMSPTIVFIDEIDQTISRSSGAGDSGVSARFFKRLLEFMSDTTHRGKVVFLAATNRPDLMDSALKRPGRFDKKVPFLVPNVGERLSIFEVMVRRYGLQPLEGIPQSVLQKTDKYTGAEIEGIAVKAVELMQDENFTPADALVQATNRLRPSTKDIEFMTLVALAECNDLDLLPDDYREQLTDRAALDSKISALAPKERSTRTV